jgi:hypothetical protein
MHRDSTARQHAQGRGMKELPTKGGLIASGEAMTRPFWQIAGCVLLGAALFAAGCATESSGESSRTTSSISGRGSLGGYPGKCMGGAGGTKSGSTASGMGSCESQ